ncbi:flippase-like domain-containing protein [bacterium]|nr:flippase-like domain-containing protein [bacterium]
MLVGAASMLPGGLGAAEWSLSTLLQSLGKLQEPLLANQATLLTRLVTLWFGFPLGVWAVWWATKKRGLHDSG